MHTPPRACAPLSGHLIAAAPLLCEREQKFLSVCLSYARGSRNFLKFSVWSRQSLERRGGIKSEALIHEADYNVYAGSIRCDTHTLTDTHRGCAPRWWSPVRGDRPWQRAASHKPLCALPGTCPEWTNHANCLGEKPSVRPKMKAGREALSTASAAPAFLPLLCLLLSALSGEKADRIFLFFFFHCSAFSLLEACCVHARKLLRIEETWQADGAAVSGCARLCVCVHASALPAVRPHTHTASALICMPEGEGIVNVWCRACILEACHFSLKHGDVGGAVLNVCMIHIVIELNQK